MTTTIGIPKMVVVQCGSLTTLDDIKQISDDILAELKDGADILLVELAGAQYRPEMLALCMLDCRRLRQHFGNRTHIRFWGCVPTPECLRHLGRSAFRVYPDLESVIKSLAH